MRYYPIFLDMAGRMCVVVGGGQVAERKVLSLIEAGADVTVVSPGLTKALTALVRSGRVSAVKRAFREGDLRGAALAVAASDSKAVNARVYESASGEGVLVNTVDDPARCDFIVPSVIDRGSLVVAVSTGGMAPGMAKALRKTLEKTIGPEYAAAVEIVGAARRHLLKTGAGRVKKERVINALAEQLPDLVRSGSRSGINALLTEHLGRGQTLSRLGVRL